ncbi:MAG: hypothetical protein M1404_04530 [Acidobacteria bacterium]|nr:hypothetical protein [Acidobacteriota bacterium]
MFLVIEAGLVVLAVALALKVPNLGSRWFERTERRFGKLAERRGLSVVVVGLTALALRAALLPIRPIPVPGVSDEYGYLLLSDTFAHGRLTNPTNPMWVHFETFQVIWQPTYTAKYYPAQGLIMALGQVITGQPFWGVWLSVGLMCAAITWMLQGWLEPGWALLGGFLAVIRLGTFSYWANSYWGGAVAAIGGALALGALPRLKKDLRVRNALLMGLGFAILANSRPYEGLFFGVAVAVALLVWLWKMKRAELGRALKHAVAPLFMVLALTMVAMGYYNWRTTGSPFNPPYLAYEHAYNPVPIFPWQPLKPIPAYRHKFIRENYLKYFTLPQYQQDQSARGLAGVELKGASLFWSFFLGPLFTLPLALALLTLPYGFSWKEVSSGTRFLLLVCAVTLAGEALPTAYAPHYSAPITCAIIALVLVAIRQVRPWQWRGKPAGVFVSRAVPSIGVLLLVLLIGGGIFRWPPSLEHPDKGMVTWCSPMPSNTDRAAMLARLEQYPGRQLVIVRQNNIHSNAFCEWVYNRADLNSARVIWADDMGPAKNQELIKYFANRHAWLLDADDKPPKLVPYGSEGDSARSIQAEKSVAPQQTIKDK